MIFDIVQSHMHVVSCVSYIVARTITFCSDDERCLHCTKPTCKVEYIVLAHGNNTLQVDMSISHIQVN
jgi:hypothetical protein